MEVAIGSNTPFQREVREWQRIDPNTGALLTGRLEADRWINGPLNAYGKVVDSKNMSTPNGTHMTQRKQLEVLQARTSSGSQLQVVRAHTVQTSSSRWSTTSATASSTPMKQSITSHIADNNLNRNSSGNDNDNTNINSNISGGSGTSVNSIRNSFRSAAASSIHHLTSPSLNTNHLITKTATSNHPHSITNNSMSSYHDTSPKYNNTLENTILPIITSTGRFIPSQSSSNGAATTIAPSQITVASALVGTTTTSVTQSKSLHNTLKIPTENHSITNKYRVGCAGTVNLSQMGIETNERETFYNNSHSSFVRGKSISTEDLATERDEHNFDDDVEPAEWRRVSKIRRSLQFPKSTTIRTTSSRPTDLPENLVSVSKIRQELENGRRLNTAMRNNHVDLEALDNILKSVTETATHCRAEGKSTKKTTYITAESLKEVRGKLRKLSDESLYKDDILVQAENESEEKSDNSRGLTEMSNKSTEHTMPMVKLDGETRLQNLTNNIMMRNSVKLGQGNSGLAEPRANNKYKDMMSSDWHWRRKSYGFEKMAPPSESMSSRMETSTDSGIGRSGELTTSWSPTEQTPRGTIITFGDTTTKPNNTATSIVHLNETNQSQNIQKPMSYATTSATTDDYEIKRHSIAVDETRYVRDNLRRVFEQKTSVHLNGLYSKDENMSQQSFLDDKDSRKQKRVEFCKTEVHFAAESGRVNIVETDGKPPPTNNFRRRRRTSGGSIGTTYMEAINSGLPVTHFGDAEKRTAIDTIENEDGLDEPLPSPTKQGVLTTPMVTATTFTFEKNGNVYDEEDQYSGMPGDETSLRGILKNKPIKPKPYHLGENIESGDSLWGVRLKPVTARWHQNLSPTESPTRDEDTTTVQTYVPSSVHINESKTIQSVADRVRNAEEMKSDSTNIGFSTKVNLTTAQPTFTWQNKDNIQPQYESPKASPCFNDNTRKLLDDLDKTKIRVDMRHFGDTYAAPLVTQRHNELKSTSLIMKTLRSATQFDEAMRKLSFNSTEDQSEDNNYKSAFSSLHTSNAVMKSSSTSSLAHNYSPISYRKNEKSRYASSLDGDSIKPNYFEASEYKPFESLPQTYKNTTASSVSSSSTASFSFEKHQSEPVQRRGSGTGLFEKVDSHRLETVVDGQVLTSCGQDPKKPVAAPRLKKLSTANTISHQLTQLRRLYDAADLEDSDDSAKLDEEVNLYLGKLGNAEERTSELSGSWSRVKAKRKQKENEQIRTQIHNDNKTNILYEKSINITEKEFKSNSGTKPADMVHSNVMSIELQSPSGPVVKPVIQPIAVTSITKPRTVSPVKQIQQTMEIQSTKQDNRKYIDFNKKSEEKDSLKLVRGARKLRDHELSYFGVNVSKTSSMSSNSSTSSLSSFSGHIQPSHQTYNGSSMRQLNTNANNSASPLTKLTSPIVRSVTTSETKWQMTNNKPDLLRHSPNIDNKATKSFEYVPSKLSPSNDRSKLLEEISTKVTSEPIYENLKQVKRSSYSRKSDLERDERILDELTKAADQILSAVKGYTNNESNEATKKVSAKQRAHLDTIVENRSTAKSMQSKGVQVSGGYDDNDPRRHHRLCRLSSASSNESLSRKTPPKTVHSARSSTRSQQHSSLHNGHNGHSNDDHHSVQSSNRSSRRRIVNGGMAMSNCSTATGECKRMHRTSSRDTINSYASSSEDLTGGRNNDVQPRRPRRIKLKEKEKPEKSSASAHYDSKRASMSSNRSTLASIGDRSNSKRHSHQSHHGEGSSTSRSRATSRATSLSSTIDHNSISNNKLNRLKVSQAPLSAAASVSSTTTTAKTTTTTSAAGVTTTTLNNSSAHRNGRSGHHHRHHRDTAWK